MTSTPTEMDPVQQLALDHLHLIEGCTRPFRSVCGPRYSLDDARQDGWLGLVDAARSWDPDRGCAFPAWARPRIRRAIRVGAGRVAGAHGRRFLSYQPASPNLLVHRVESLDAPAVSFDPDAEPLAARVVGTADTENEAIARLELTAAVAAAEAIATSPRGDRCDRLVLAWLLDLGDTRSQLQLANTFGVHPQLVWRRSERLRAAMRAAAPTIATGS